MSTWGHRLWPSGRYSPFAATQLGGPPPTVTEDDYHYLGPDDEIEPEHIHRSNDGYGFTQPRNTTRVDSNSSTSPDILVLKHKNITYPIHLEPFSIGEGILKVGELRRRAAAETNTDDPRRIKLLYKGRVLKEDGRTCREEGLKQNSELTCVIRDVGSLGSRQDVESSDSADSEEIYESNNGGPRIDVDGTIRDQRSKRKNHRGGRRKNRTPENSTGPTTAPRDSGGYLAPEPISTARSHSPSRRSGSPLPAPLNHAPAPAAPTYPPKPKTPLETLEAISLTFHTIFLPKCKHYMSHPPNDTKARNMEYKKLSETILGEILLKLDAVETDGDDRLRAKRKELVNETQAVLSELDRVVKAAR